MSGYLVLGQAGCWLVPLALLDDHKAAVAYSRNVCQRDVADALRLLGRHSSPLLLVVRVLHFKEGRVGSEIGKVFYGPNGEVIE